MSDKEMLGCPVETAQEIALKAYNGAYPEPLTEEEFKDKLKAINREYDGNLTPTTCLLKFIDEYDLKSEYSAEFEMYFDKVDNMKPQNLLKKRGEVPPKPAKKVVKVEEEEIDEVPTPKIEKPLSKDEEGDDEENVKYEEFDEDELDENHRILKFDEIIEEFGKSILKVDEGDRFWINVAPFREIKQTKFENEVTDQKTGEKKKKVSWVTYLSVTVLKGKVGGAKVGKPYEAVFKAPLSLMKKLVDEARKTGADHFGGKFEVTISGQGIQKTYTVMSEEELRDSV